jgi:hypothetical protein
MRTQRIDSGLNTPDTSEPDPDPQATESAIMTVLLSGGHEGPWTEPELEREMGASALQVKDALSGLRGAGLVHLHAELVLTTRAAQRMDQLDL